MFSAAIESALAKNCVPRFLPAVPRGRTIVVGAGKAVAAMAEAVERHWAGPLSGLVITRYGHTVPCSRIEVVEAGHPVPDAAGVQTTHRILELLTSVTADDLVLCLLSGGGSALMVAPPPGISLSDEQNVVGALLKSGAPIAAINCVRKHLSMVGGGRLALAAAPAQLVTLVISDVPGDDLSMVASGPTVPDPTTRSEALAVLSNYDIRIAASVKNWLEDPASETPKPGAFGTADCHLIATPQMALEAAARVAREHGYEPLLLGSAIEGEAREVAKVHAGIVRQIQRYDQPVASPCIILSGGETTVTVRGPGRGGRNAEFLLALALEIDGEAGVYALAGDTDGIDGTESNAGAVIGPATIARAKAAGIAAQTYLARNDGYGFFAAVDALVITGPTLTNVNDFRAILVDCPKPCQEHSLND